jgi:hypothetical protein
MRDTYAETQIPAAGHESPPYIDQREIVNKFGLLYTEAFVGEILGAGGAGGSLANIPFQPAVIVLSEATGPLLQLQVPGSGGAVDINMITGAAAGAAIPAAVKQADGTYTLSLPTGLVPDGDTASLLILGFREGANGL